MLFNKNLNDLLLDIFGPTIHSRWDKQSKNFKNELINFLVGLFDNERFIRADVLNKAGQHIKIVRDQFKVHLERNPRYDLPPMIPSRE